MLTGGPPPQCLEGDVDTFNEFRSPEATQNSGHQSTESRRTMGDSFIHRFISQNVNMTSNEDKGDLSCSREREKRFSSFSSASQPSQSASITRNLFSKRKATRSPEKSPAPFKDLHHFPGSASIAVDPRHSAQPFHESKEPSSPASSRELKGPSSTKQTTNSITSSLVAVSSTPVKSLDNATNTHSYSSVISAPTSVLNHSDSDFAKSSPANILIRNMQSNHDAVDDDIRLHGTGKYKSEFDRMHTLPAKMHFCTSAASSVDSQVENPSTMPALTIEIQPQPSSVLASSSPSRHVLPQPSSLKTGPMSLELPTAPLPKETDSCSQATAETSAADLAAASSRASTRVSNLMVPGLTINDPGATLKGTSQNLSEQTPSQKQGTNKLMTSKEVSTILFEFYSSEKEPSVSSKKESQVRSKQSRTKRKAAEEQLAKEAESSPSSHFDHQETSSHSATSHDSLPLNLRNKKMKPTDCLLFAATLLEQNGDKPNTIHELNSIVTKNISNSSSLFEEQFSLFTATGQATSESRRIQSKIASAIPKEKLPDPRTLASVAAQVLPLTSGRSGDGGTSPKPRDEDVLCGRGGLINSE